MKPITNITILIFIVYISIITHNVQSYSLHNQRSSDEISIEPYLIDNIPSSSDEYGPMENLYSPEIDSLLNKRRTDSAERYFDWAGKTNRPMEYFRGKRFWLFTKKDEQLNNQEVIPNSAGSPTSYSQGIWRSGIVGRRRR